MKILQYTILTLTLGAVSVFAQTPESPVEIARNSPAVVSKRASALTGTEGETVSKPAAPILSRTGVDNEQPVSLSLSEAIRKAVENNNDIEVSKQNVRKAEFSLRRLFGLYDPVFTTSPTYTDDVRPVTSIFGGGGSAGTFSSKQFTVNSDVVNSIKPGGGNYRVFFNNNRTQTSATSSQFTPTYDTGLGVEYNQPLLRNFKIDINRQQIRAQRKRVSQSDEDFRAQTINTVAQVQRSYWDLVFALRDQQNKVENLNLSKENLRQVEAKIKAGSAAPLARAEVLTELANREADVIVAAQQVSIAENSLKQLIIRDPTSSEWGNQLIPTDRPVLGDDAVNLDAVVKDAVANRPELTRLRLEREINDIAIQYFKNQLKPRVDLRTSYSLAGVAGTPTGSVNSITAPLIFGNPSTNPDAFLLQQLQILNPSILVPSVTTPSSVNQTFVGGYGKSLQNLFSTDYRTIVVGVTISFPFKNTEAKADLGSARAERTRLEADTRSNEQTVIVEVRNAVQAVESARQRILAAREALKNAEIQLEGQRKLYELGRSDTFLLFQRENELAAAKNALIRAETDYNKAVADLQRATATTLTVNNIQLDTPVRDK